MAEQLWDKLGLQQQQNQTLMHCSTGVKGLFFELRMREGKSTALAAPIRLGSVKRTKENDWLECLRRGGESQSYRCKKSLAHLREAGVLHVSPSGIVMVACYAEEQARPLVMKGGSVCPIAHKKRGAE
jgi:hypothetical protein